MRRTILSILLLDCVVALAHPVAAQTGPAGPEPGLLLSIVRTKDTFFPQLYLAHDEQFELVFTNRSNQSIRLWDPWCQPALSALSLRFTDKKANSWTMHRPLSNPDHADLRPRTSMLAPGASYTWRVKPTDFSHAKTKGTTLPEPNGHEELTVTAVFEIKADAQAKEYGVWTGYCESAPMRLTFYAPNLRTPHQYLRNGYPRQALKIMKAEPTWVHQLDPEEHCTPLHLAARFGFTDVGEWLLANGAAVNAKTYYEATPLTLTSEPALVRLLLEYMPKEKARAAPFLQAPLERAAAEFARRGEDVESWRQIVKLLLDAGAPYHLQSAIYLNDIERVRAILKDNPRLAKDDGDGARSMPLRVAARTGRVEICKILLANKADPDDWENGGGFPILVYAVQHPAVVKLLLDAGADIKRRISCTTGRTGAWLIQDKATALHYAAEAGSLESAKLLLDRGIDVDARDDWNQSALDIAANDCHLDMVQLLAGRVGSAKARNEGWQALFRRLVAAGQLEQVKALLPKQVIAEMLPKEGPELIKWAASGLEFAGRKQQQEANAAYLGIVDQLRKCGVPVDVYTAITIDDVARVKELLKKEPRLANSKDFDGAPVLHRAITLNRKAIVPLLLGSDAHVHGVDEDGYTPLHTTARGGRDEIARLLISHKANVNARTKTGETPLHSAAYAGQAEVVKLLLAAGANVSALDDKGRTPLSWAEESHWPSPELISLLRKRGAKN